MPKAVQSKSPSSQKHPDRIQPIPPQSQSEDSLRLRIERLEILHEIDQSIIAAQEIQITAQSILDRLALIIPGYRASSALLFAEPQSQLLAIDFNTQSSPIDQRIDRRLRNR
jgi:hypothetical protein